jgi:hypothetical protein
MIATAAGMTAMIEALEFALASLLPAISIA